jgi:ABC-type antimicrobial peptide transport system permease subunit
LDESDPWSTLNLILQDNVIPAIADETVIKWGLGKEVGDTLIFQDAQGDLMKLLLVGGTSPSIFQGSVIISEENFLRHFPTSSGSNVFLVEGSLADTAFIQEEITLGMRDLGWTMELTGTRLAEFNSVTNTYLSIFMILGALGLLLGTIGLGMVIFRSIIERRKELGLLRAMGFSLGKIRNLVAREYLLLFIVGTFIGGISSLVATLPAFLSKNTDASLSLILIILGILLLNGLFWIYAITGTALSSRPLVNAIRNE